MGDKAKLAITALLTVLVALALGACGGDGGSDDSTGPTDTTTAEADAGQDGTTPPDSSQPSGGDDSGGGEPKSGDGSSKGEQAPDSGSSGDGQDGGGSDGGKSGGGSDGGGQKSGSKKSGGARPPEPANEQLKGIEDFGSEAASSDSDEAEAILGTYLKSYSSKEWKAACATLAKPALANLAKFGSSVPQVNSTDCVTILSSPNLAFNLGPAANIDSLSSFRVEGNVGYAFYEDGKLVMLMQKEGGEWKVNGVQPEPVP